MSVAPRKHMTAAEFLEWDTQQSVRHEFVDGDVFAMSGASRNHVQVVMNLTTQFVTALRGKRCRPFATDLKLRVSELDNYYYPDVFVTCAAEDLASPLVMERPSVIVEVLSDSTAAYDRGDKFRAYRRISQFKEYVLIDPEARRIDRFRRDGTSDRWMLEEVPADSALELQSIGVALAWADVFENVS